MLISRNKICRLVLLCLLLCITSEVWSQRVERAIVDWNPTHYAVAVTLNDSLTEISAITEIELQVVNSGLDHLQVQFGDLIVDSVKLGGTKLAFEQKPGLIVIALPLPVTRGTNLRVSIRYHGIPKDGLILTKDKDGTSSATGDNWPDRVHNWIPCIDHPSAKASVTFTITAPERDHAIANGRFVSKQSNGNKSITWTYDEKVPIPPYCMVIAVDQFDISGPSTRKHLTFVVPESDRELANEFAPAEQMLDFFSQRIAPYPYEKLALIVGSTQFGGMENSGAIVFPSNFLRRNENESLTKTFKIPVHVEETTAHEIAHQWFGDSVTESTWADLWLSEGFATYFAGLFLERYEGSEVFGEYMQRQKVIYLGYEKQISSPIHDTKTTDLFRLLNANNYQKGAWVLHMLRGMLGDEKFFNGLAIYYRNHKNSNANSGDLRVALENASGQSLKTFFDRWVYGEGHPILEVEWQGKNQEGRSTVALDINQIQHNSPFLMPVTILIKTDRGEIRKTIELTGSNDHFELSIEGKPIDVEIDPDNFLLAETTARRK